MSDGSPTDYGTELAEGVLEIASQFIDKKIVEAIRKNFTCDGKMQRGDFYMSQSQQLLHIHYEVILPADKRSIYRMLSRLD